MKLFPCCSGITGEKFGNGNETFSSARIESNFNHLKNRVFKNEQMPLKIDTFVEKLLLYYKGDHLLVQANISTKKISNLGTSSSPIKELLYVDEDDTNICNIDNQDSHNERTNNFRR